MFVVFCKVMYKVGLWWYGVWVVELYYDGIVYWYLLCFMCKKDCCVIIVLLCKFVICEDCEELGNNIGLCFKFELINLCKGMLISYIVKYISKNIDGCGLVGEISKEMGKFLCDNVEYVNVWVFLYCVQ